MVSVGFTYGYSQARPSRGYASHSSHMKHVSNKTQRDKLVIEALVRREGLLSRSDIHALTSLQQSEISRMVGALLREGKLQEAGRAANPMGRKQVLLRFNEDHQFIAALAFDDESVHASVVNLHPRLREQVREPTCVTRGTEGLVQQLLLCMREALRRAGIKPADLAGIGIAGSGLVDSRRGRFLMSSTVEILEDIPVKDIFEDAFGAPVILENLTRAKAVAERRLGAGNRAEDMIFIEYGRTGIGAGIILNGNLVHGSGCAAGEFGHTHMVNDGPACKCGSVGCLEALVGAAALEARARKLIHDGNGALALAGGDSKTISGWTVLEAAAKGEPACAALVEELGTYLGLGLANLVNLFNPSVLVIDQRLRLAGETLLERIIATVRRQALRHATKDLAIRFGTLGSEAAVLGVAVLALEKHFEIPLLKPPRFMIESVVPRKGGVPASP